ncbi:MAG: glycosyltransferase [Chloroflexota bacterium]
MQARIAYGLATLAGLLAERNYRRLDALDLEGESGEGDVSIVVPARNEASNLPRLLESLGRLKHRPREVVVVDDGSSDGTGWLADSHGARVIRVDMLPNGWTGKAFACHTGARDTAGEWILFTDADTAHAARSLGAALQAAQARNADVLSLLCRQECGTFWERVLLPYAYFLYFAGASGLNGNSRTAVANGQYILCRRKAYEDFGGHAAVRSSLIEDVDLARRAAAAGYRVVLLRGEALVRVRMYRGLFGIWEGFGKNSFRLVRASPRTGTLTALTAVAFLSCAVQMGRYSGRDRLLLLIAPSLSIAPWYRRFGVPGWFSLLHPVAALVFQGIALDAIRRTFRSGRTSWKGRRY